MPFKRFDSVILRADSGKIARGDDCCCGNTLTCQIFGTRTPYDLQLAYDCPDIATHGLVQTQVTPNYIWAGTGVCTGATPSDWGVEVRCTLIGDVWSMVWATSVPGGGTVTWTQIEFFRGATENLSYIKFKGTIGRGCCGDGEIIATLTRP